MQVVKPGVIDTDMSFISENTNDGNNCLQSYDECLYEFKLQYVNLSVDKIEALRDPQCEPLQASFVRKL